MNKFDFNNLLTGVKQMGQIIRGERKPSRRFIVQPFKVKSVRKKVHLSQAQFARLIGVSPATLRNWEQGRTYPEGAARALLMVADKRPDAILEALHAA